MAPDGESDRLRALLRLADKRGNGFPAERQLALDRALDIARKVPVAIEDMLEEHRIDVSDLRCPRWRLPREGSAAASRYQHLIETYGPHGRHDPPSREECAGIYRVAGFRYYDGPDHRHRMRAGDPVSLSRVIGNPHDRFAVFVTWKGLDLGHLPRGRNEPVWRYLATRQPLVARVAHVAPGPGRYGDIEIEVL